MKYIAIFSVFVALSVPVAGQSALDELTKKAQAGDADAQFQLGQAYEDGNSVSKDDEEAVRWYRKAAEQDNARAANGLGVMYREGRGVSRDKAEAFRWYRKAARLGLAEADYNVAICYYNGDGVASDVNRAYAWMLLAKHHGNTSAEQALNTMSTEIANRVGLATNMAAELYLKGEETPRDVSAAVEIYRQVASKNGQWNPSGAQYKLCQIYFAGDGIPQDYAQARSWCRKAAENEVENSFALLGHMAEQGLGGPRDLKEAEKWYFNAALMWKVEGPLALGRLKAQGSSHQDQKEAYFWFFLAHEFGAKDAEKEALNVATKLSNKEMSQAQKKVSEWTSLRPAERSAKLKYP